MGEMVMSKMDPRMLRAVNDSMHCANQCLETFNHCLHMGGKHTDPEHLNTLLDCIDTCRLTENAMIRNSEFSAQICYLNAVVCERCAESCFRTAPEDEHMKECSDICRSCALSCRAMSKR